MKIEQFDPFIVAYNPVTYPIDDFKTECIRAARKIAAKNIENRPIAMTMSGGLDSEIMAESFRQAGIPFIAVIARYFTIAKNDFINSYDFKYAERWCKKHNVEIRYCDLDLYKDAETIYNFALEGRSFSPQLGVHMYIFKWCSDMGYFFVSSNCEYRVMLQNDIYVLGHRQRVYALNNFCKVYDLKGDPSFLRQDARMILSYLELPSIRKLMEQRCEDLHYHRYEGYADVFDFEPREKYTGFENMSEWDGRLRWNLKKVNLKYDETLYIPISELGK